MQIVIDIPEKIINRILEYKEISNIDLVIEAIYHGTSLPKGHGRLIDADALMEYCQNCKSKVIDCNDIARFPTIIRREE